MGISEVKKKIVIDNYFKEECDVNTSIKEAFIKGFELGLKKAPVNPQPKTERCKWIRYDYRTICPKNHDIDNPYWRIPENTEHLKYCPYCGKEVEVTK